MPAKGEGEMGWKGALLCGVAAVLLSLANMSMRCATLQPSIMPFRDGNEGQIILPPPLTQQEKEWRVAYATKQIELFLAGKPTELKMQEVHQKMERFRENGYGSVKRRTDRQPVAKFRGGYGLNLHLWLSKPNHPAGMTYPLVVFSENADKVVMVTEPYCEEVRVYRVPAMAQPVELTPGPPN